MYTHTHTPMHLKFTIQTIQIEVSNDVVVSWTNNFQLWKLLVTMNILDIFFALEFTKWLVVFTYKKLVLIMITTTLMVWMSDVTHEVPHVQPKQAVNTRRKLGSSQLSFATCPHRN